MSAEIEDMANIIEEFATNMIEEELREMPPERRATITPQRIEEVRERLVNQGLSTAVCIGNKPELYRRCRRGLLDPGNKHSRMVFERVTGLTLPKKSSDTTNFIREYVGNEVVSAYFKEREDAERAKTEAREAEKKQKHEAHIARITAAILAKKQIGGHDLIDIARHVGIDVHPRTVGSIRSNVVWIEMGQARISNRKFNTQSAHKLLRAVVDHLTEAK